MKQVLDLKDTASMDESTFDALKQIIVDGHDGAHPNLPPVNRERAAILVVLMKDVLYQLYVRQAMVQEAMNRRQAAIEAKKQEG